jgi:hypothetical protein
MILHYVLKTRLAFRSINNSKLKKTLMITLLLKDIMAVIVDVNSLIITYLFIKGILCVSLFILYIIEI